jgi:hypothetical protein
LQFGFIIAFLAVLTLADFTAYDPVSHNIITVMDHAYMCDHAFRKGANYIVYIDGGGCCIALDAATGKIAFGGPDNVGAVDGTDASAVINAAIAACPWVYPDYGGKVMLTAQLFELKSTVNLDTGVSLVGQGSDSTYFYAVSGTFPDDDVMLNVGAHHRVNVEGIRFYSNAANTTAIYAGDDTGAETYHVVLRDLFLWNMAIGIDTGEAALDTGCYDSTFYDIQTSDITDVGIVVVGSGMTLVNPRIGCSATGTGLKLAKATGYAVGAAGSMIGGVFAVGQYNIEVDNMQEWVFNGTWFEEASDGIVNVGAGSTFCRLTFDTCRLAVKQGVGCPHLMDFSAYAGAGIGKVDIRNCKIEGTPDNFNSVPIIKQTQYDAGSVDPTNYMLYHRAPNELSTITVSGYIRVTAYTSGDLYFIVSFSDVNGNPKSVYVPTFSDGGVVNVPISAGGYYTVPAVSFRVNADSVTSIGADGDMVGTYDIAAVATTDTENKP